MDPPNTVRVDNAFIDEDANEMVQQVQQLARELGQTEESAAATIRLALVRSYVRGLTKGIRAAGAEPKVVDEP